MRAPATHAAMKETGPHMPPLARALFRMISPKSRCGMAHCKVSPLSSSISKAIRSGAETLTVHRIWAKPIRYPLTVSRPEIKPLAESHLGDAAALLSRRHLGHRAMVPQLSSRFEDPTACLTAIGKLWGQDDASGAVALVAGQVSGFVFGSPKDVEGWGPNMWVEAAGQASEDPELLRDLYGLAAQRWVDEGRTAHYVIIPSYDRAVTAAWFHLGFGLQHVHALRESAGEPLVPVPKHVRIRRADRLDVERLAELDLVLPHHQATSPVFSGREIPSVEEVEAEWREGIDDLDYMTFVAETEAAVVGLAIGAAAEKSSAHAGLSRPDDAAILGYAAVAPEARGRGIGLALGSAVLVWAHEAGFPVTVTDWRATNLLSSRAWPRLGFQETFHRLHRLVGF